MARSRSNRVALADLVTLVLICGLFVALFRSSGRPAEVSAIFFLMVVVLMVWAFSQAKRKALPCEECGRPFYEPRKASGAIACPECGSNQLSPTRAMNGVTTIFWVLLVLPIVLVVVIGFLLSDAAAALPELTRAAVGLVLSGSIMLTLLAAISLGVYLSYATARPRDLTCEACGTIIPPKPVDGPVICPQCRQRHLRPDEAKKENAKGLGYLLIILAILGIFGAAMLSRSAGTMFGMSPWVGILLLVLVSIMSVSLATFVILILVWKLRVRRLRSEQGALAMARKCSGVEGEVVRQGPTSIWFSGPTDPVPMLREAMENARQQFGELLGEKIVAEPPVRILCFHDRGAFLRFHRRIFPALDFSSFDRLYFPSPHQLLTLCAAQAPCRLTDTERTARSVYSYALMEAVWGALPVSWLQSGLYGTLAGGGDRAELARLNRKMVASLSLGTSFSTELFTMSPNDLGKLLRGGKDPRNWQKYPQFVQQSWSIIEYLRDGKESGEPRSELGAFLKDARSKTHQEESFRLHFGYGFGPLLDGWRQWVLDRGIGSYDPPPPPIRDGLLDRVIPTVRDRKAKRGDRILAIHELGSAGFVLGADALIELLRENDDIPKEEIVWALSMISGLAWGDDPGRWQTWLDDLPMTWMEPQPDGLETESPVRLSEA